MKKIVMLGLAALMSTGLMAQHNGGHRPDRAKMTEQRASHLSKVLDLKGEAKKQFEALYMQYVKELQGENPERGREQTERKQPKDMSDAEATTQLKELLERQEKVAAEAQRRCDVQKKYIDEFSKSLTPQQVLQVMRGNQRMQQRQQGGGQMHHGEMGHPQGGGGFGGGFGGSDF